MELHKSNKYVLTPISESGSIDSTKGRSIQTKKKHNGI